MPWMVIVGLDNVVQRTVFVDQGRIIVEQESASPLVKKSASDSFFFS